MDAKRKSTRRNLLSIRSIQSYEDLLSKVILTPTERSVLNMKYLENMSIVQISFRLHLSESRVLQIHKSALAALGNFI